ncbi:cystathionine beta-lyase [Ranunculus cassubicifolius]
MSSTCGNCDCADKTNCVKKGNVIIVETEKSYFDAVVEVSASENDCKCGASCKCTDCKCGGH